MQQITIRKLDDHVIHMVKKIAWMNGQSPEDAARKLLIEAVQARTGTRQPLPKPAARELASP